MISEEEGKDFAKENNCLFKMVSAKENKGNAIDAIFEEMSLRILNSNKNSEEFIKSQKETIRFQKDCLDYSKRMREGYKNSKGGCCG